MKGSNTLAIILCGLVTGVLFFLLTVVTVTVFARDFLSELQTAPRYPKLGGLWFLAADLLMGVWVIWLYAVLAARRGPGLRTGVIAGFAWWAMKALQSAHWVGLGFVPSTILVGPFITSLISAMVAAATGAMLYDMVRRQTPPPAEQPPS
jgi:hypothetical protein